MSIGSSLRGLKRALSGPKRDLPYPCHVCDVNVPPFAGIREGGYVFCSENCSTTHWWDNQI